MDTSVCGLTLYEERKGREPITEAVLASLSEPSTPIEPLPNEVLLEIFLSLDGRPTDFVSVKGTCRHFAELVVINEHENFLKWMQKQSGFQRIILENLYARNRQSGTGIRHILEGYARAVALVSVTDALERIHVLDDSFTFANLGRNQDAEDFVHRRRRCMTIFLGAEIHALEPEHERLLKAIGANQQKRGAMILDSVIGLATSVVWRSYVKARARGDRSEVGIMNGHGKGAIEGFTQAIFGHGTRSWDDILSKTLQVDPADELAALVEAIRSWKPVQADNYPRLMNYSRLQTSQLAQTRGERSKALWLAFGGSIRNWKEVVPDEEAWGLLMLELGWLVPLPQ